MWLAEEDGVVVNDIVPVDVDEGDRELEMMAILRIKKLEGSSWRKK